MNDQLQSERALGPTGGVRGSPPSEVAEQTAKRAAFGQLRGMLSAVAIFLYFAVATVWLPSAILRSSLLSGASRNVADAVALAAWIVGLGAGMWGLRRAQDRIWI
jgi:hypothetical protein